MNYFVLFSVILIVACVIVLLLPLNQTQTQTQTQNAEGFLNYRKERDDVNDVNEVNYTQGQVSAADQRSLSNAAGSADGSSDHQHLLDNLLQNYDRLAEAFETRDAKSNAANAVSATTTKKNSIASTSAITEPFETRNAVKSGDISVAVGCNEKCVKITGTSDSIGGSCVNPPISETNKNPDYSKKYCPAFRVPDGDYSMREQECATCGYYTFTAECKQRADPKDKTKCTRYGAYAYQRPTGTNPYMTCKPSNDPICNLFLEKGGGGGAGGEDSATGTACSVATCKPKEVTIPGVTSATKKCVIPGCLSTSGGMLPYPKDFYGNDMINPCIKDTAGTGYLCPAITPITPGGTEYGSYNSGGGSGDPCYTTGGRVDKAKFQSMNTVPKCNNVRPASVQNFAPTNVGDNPNPNPNDNSGQSSGSSSGSNSGQSSGSQTLIIDVYHHRGSSSRQRGSSIYYAEPEPGPIYLGLY